jgi:hypothetical protein
MALPPENIIIKRSKVISSTSDSNVEDNDVQDIKQKTSHKSKKIFYHNYLIDRYK